MFYNDNNVGVELTIAMSWTNGDNQTHNQTKTVHIPAHSYVQEYITESVVDGYASYAGISYDQY